jgi:hypothetical protein
MVEILKNIVQNVYYNRHYLNCKQTCIAAIHLRFQGYVPVSAVVVYITMNECTVHCINVFFFVEYLETCRRFTTRCISFYLNISAVVGVCVYIYNHGSTALYGLGPPLSEVTRSLCICGSQ